MTHRRSSILAAALLLAGAVIAAAPAQAPAPSPAPLALEPAALASFLSDQVASRHLVGLSLAVMRDGQVVYAGGAGQAVLATNAAVTPRTRFAIGSITKQFTSACVLLLAEDGKLSVNDKVAKWFPTLTAANTITVLDLMNHVSGYPDYYPLDFVDRPMQQAIEVPLLIERFGTRKLDFEPGTRYSYSNTGFVILGEIVAKASGKPFAAFLQERVLEPLGLADTVFEPKAGDPALAQGYVTFALGPPEVPAPEGPGWVYSAGALYSTPSDLVRWDLALMEGKVLKPESYRLMTSPRKLADGSMSNYGCGLSTGTRAGQPRLSHNGAVAGFYALNTMFPAGRSAVVLLSNFDAYDDVNAVYGRVVDALVPAPAPAVSKAGEPKPAAPAHPAGIPVIAGPAAPEAARLLFLQIQAGHVDRAQLGEEYSYFLTDAKLQGASARLREYGAPEKVALTSVSERGGMEVAGTRLFFPKGTLVGSMYRTPDGKVQQFFISKE